MKAEDLKHFILETLELSDPLLISKLIEVMPETTSLLSPEEISNEVIPSIHKFLKSSLPNNSIPKFNTFYNFLSLYLDYTILKTLVTDKSKEELFDCLLILITSDFLEIRKNAIKSLISVLSLFDKKRLEKELAKIEEKLAKNKIQSSLLEVAINVGFFKNSERPIEQLEIMERLFEMAGAREIVIRNEVFKALPEIVAAINCDDEEILTKQVAVVHRFLELIDNSSSISFPSIYLDIVKEFIRNQAISTHCIELSNAIQKAVSHVDWRIRYKFVQFSPELVAAAVNNAAMEKVCLDSLLLILKEDEDERVIAELLSAFSKIDPLKIKRDPDYYNELLKCLNNDKFIDPALISSFTEFIKSLLDTQDCKRIYPLISKLSEVCEEKKTHVFTEKVRSMVTEKNTGLWLTFIDCICRTGLNDFESFLHASEDNEYKVLVKFLQVCISNKNWNIRRALVDLMNFLFDKQIILSGWLFENCDKYPTITALSSLCVDITILLLKDTAWENRRVSALLIGKILAAFNLYLKNQNIDENKEIQSTIDKIYAVSNKLSEELNYNLRIISTFISEACLIYMFRYYEVWDNDFFDNTVRYFIKSFNDPIDNNQYAVVESVKNNLQELINSKVTLSSEKKQGVVELTKLLDENKENIEEHILKEIYDLIKQEKFQKIIK